MTRMTSKTTQQRHFNALSIIGIGLAGLLAASSARAQAPQPGDVQPQPGEQQYSQDQGSAPPQAMPPQMLTLPAGTVIRVRVDEWLSSDRNVPGDTFSASLDQPIVVDGWVVARRGQAETGGIQVAKKAPRGGGNSELGVQLGEFTFVDGQQMPVQTEMLTGTGGGRPIGQSAATVGTTTAIGATIGAIAEGGTGAVVGGGLGAIAGLAGVMATRGKPTEIAPETVLSFRLQAPVTISTERSQMAFQPVSQADYDSHQANHRPRMHRSDGPGYPPPPYYEPYPYPYWYPYGMYPGPMVGFGIYGGYGRRWGGWR